jgi:hypothetical protein
VAEFVLTDLPLPLTARQWAAAELYNLRRHRSTRQQQVVQLPGERNIMIVDDRRQRIANTAASSASARGYMLM